MSHTHQPAGKRSGLAIPLALVRRSYVAGAKTLLLAVGPDTSRATRCCFTNAGVNRKVCMPLRKIAR